jgi:RNase adaptor protein for sRNA GlmZ degradation
MKLLISSGRSGSGKSMALSVLEYLGGYNGATPVTSIQ